MLALIVDDEPLARRGVVLRLRKFKDIEVVGQCGDGVSAVEKILDLSPDLVFLDVQMPGMDGFEVLRAVPREKLPNVIFLTAYEQHALRAFEVHAVDYLLKPFTAERLHSAIGRVLARTQPQEVLTAQSSRPDRNESKFSTRLVFKSRGRIVFLPVSDIRWIGAEENYVRVCTDTENHLLRETMAHIEERLDPEMFLRVHRSTIVNLLYVKEVRSEPNGDFTVVLINGQKLPMSRGYRSRISELFIRG